MILWFILIHLAFFWLVAVMVYLSLRYESRAHALIAAIPQRVRFAAKSYALGAMTAIILIFIFRVIPSTVIAPVNYSKPGITWRFFASWGLIISMGLLWGSIIKYMYDALGGIIAALLKRKAHAIDHRVESIGDQAHEHTKQDHPDNRPPKHEREFAFDAGNQAVLFAHLTE